MDITRAFAEDGTRYEIDFDACSYDKGFCQIDTPQDAAWFGVWTNPFERVIASYAEGDITVQHAETDAEYREALVRCLTFHPAKIDLGLSRRAEMRARFDSLGLASYCH